MTDRIEKFGLRVAPALHDFIEHEALPATGVDSDTFWRGLADLVHDFGPQNRELLARRDALQARIDAWHRAQSARCRSTRRPTRRSSRKSATSCPRARTFRSTRPTSTPRSPACRARSWSCRSMNARYALNAANARWGSLYDALYGTDAMGDLPPAGAYERGARRARHRAGPRRFSTTRCPLADGSARRRVRATRVVGGALQVDCGRPRDGSPIPRCSPAIAGEPAPPTAVLLRQQRPAHRARASTAPSRIGARPTRAGVADVVLEARGHDDHGSARTRSPRSTPRTRSLAYRNWLGLMSGDLAESCDEGRPHVRPRRLDPDRSYTAPDGTRAHAARAAR